MPWLATKNTGNVVERMRNKVRKTAVFLLTGSHMRCGVKYPPEVRENKDLTPGDLIYCSSPFRYLDTML